MTTPRPELDPFYAAVDDAPRPGELLRFREVDIKLETRTNAWQVVYGSTGSRHQPIAVSGTVFVPVAPWTQRGPRPVLSYGVGVHGLGRDSAPSYLMQLGTEAETALIDQALARGWAVVVTDGDGLGLPGPHTYGAGLPGGHAMLDIVRAARVWLEPGAPLVIWGYSEGGRCAAWAAELHPSYAPDLDLRGVAAGGVPSDLYETAKAIDAGPFSGLGLAVLVGLAHAHQNPALEAILSEAGKATAAAAATKDVVGLIVDHPEPMRHHTVRDEPWDEPVWRALLDSERNGRSRPQAPVYLYHVVDDLLVPTVLGRRLYEDYRALGADVTWADVHAEEHLAGAFVSAESALTWLSTHLRPSPTIMNHRYGS